MKRNVSTLLSTLPFVAIAALGIWVFNLNQEKGDLEARVEQTQEPAAAPSEENFAPPPMSPLEMEQRRLDELRARLEELKPAPEAAQPPTGSIDAHIANTQRRIGEVQNQLGGLKEDATAVQQNAATFAQEQTVATGADKMTLENQLQQVDTEILEAQNQVRDNPQSTESKGLVEALKAQREEINGRIRQLDTQNQTTLAAAAAQAQTEQREVLSERGDLQRQLADLRADLEYWQGQKGGADANAQTARAQALEQEIKAQAERVKALEDLNPKTEVQ